jgi:hypothetical protein
MRDVVISQWRPKRRVPVPLWRYVIRHFQSFTWYELLLATGVASGVFWMYISTSSTPRFLAVLWGALLGHMFLTFWRACTSDKEAYAPEALSFMQERRDRKAWPALAFYGDEVNADASDDGLVWFEGGMLHFEGLRSSWRIATTDVTWTKPDGTFVVPWTGLGVRLPLRIGDQMMYLSLVPYDSFAPGQERGLRQQFYDRQDEWAKAREITSQTSIYPPENRPGTRLF